MASAITRENEPSPRLGVALTENTHFFSWVMLTSSIGRVGVRVIFAFLCLVVLIYMQFLAGGDGSMLSCSATYLFCCFFGGVVSGLPHTLLTPVDLVKCRMQVGEYDSVLEGFRTIYRDAGSSLFGSISFFYRGWVPTFFGYSLQGGFKFFFTKCLNVC
ncbi:putative mitochondrial carrier protein [Trypanosoma rangeli]|uniref:Putative mitochondrial carrier protein n=1 Tax=Trypanosoma rangeli TaxID=5698 RepID=A0A422NDL2_TRYRA|nr:putative mitochondrial carrier protein [Trypanosoma rangeli]RNF03580.1 putative mitochondrial carrier protein [Trypanosoma rangeli]|eukprot:RNF03580.1 putative mitochondrial carrier protein [Trypanosoma rangeli]